MTDGFFMMCRRLLHFSVVLKRGDGGGGLTMHTSPSVESPFAERVVGKIKAVSGWCESFSYWRWYSFQAPHSHSHIHAYLPKYRQKRRAYCPSVVFVGAREPPPLAAS